jgi:hypothetical protein
MAVCQGVVSGTPGHAAVIVDNLLVRVYDNAGVPAADRRRAFARAGEILARVEVDAAWLECPARGFAWSSSRCATPPVAGELVLRLVRASTEASQRHPQALGYSVVDTETGVGTLATVFADRVELLAQRARFDRAAVLGRAMAHEIGHLILGTSRHSGSGLMREHWTFEELRRNRPGDWLFTTAERESVHAAIQAAAAARARGAAAGSGGQNPHVLLNKNP